MSPRTITFVSWSHQFFHQCHQQMIGEITIACSTRVWTVSIFTSTREQAPAINFRKCYQPGQAHIGLVTSDELRFIKSSDIITLVNLLRCLDTFSPIVYSRFQCMFGILWLCYSVLTQRIYHKWVKVFFYLKDSLKKIGFAKQFLTDLTGFGFSETEFDKLRATSRHSSFTRSKYINNFYYNCAREYCG